MKLNGDEDIFIFWDKKCLNDGQDSEVGFMNGILHSTAIILIISEKVWWHQRDRKAQERTKNNVRVLIAFKAIEEICNNAPTYQDNVLVEYPTGLHSYIS